MDPKQETDNFEEIIEVSEVVEIDESMSVDDFIKELEEKEKDLHITADTTFIQVAEVFEDETAIQEFTAPEVSKSRKKAIEPAVQMPASSDSGLKKEVSALNAKLQKMEAERSELFENSIRRSKDFEAYKVRTERERSEIFQSQLSVLATKMLYPLDNLERALAFACDLPQKKRSEFQEFFEGILLVSQQIYEVLADMGIQPIPAVGEVFDPYYHEAVAAEENSEFPPNTISEELLRGYCISDKVIRHSMVKVSKPALSEHGVYGEIDTNDQAGEAK